MPVGGCHYFRQKAIFWLSRLTDSIHIKNSVLFKSAIRYNIYGQDHIHPLPMLIVKKTVVVPKPVAGPVLR
jgi:hypothetical protein